MNNMRITDLFVSYKKKENEGTEEFTYLKSIF